MASATMTLISSQTLGGTTASVTFSSIPSTYNDLKLVVSARGDMASTANIGIGVKFNGDSATNYSYTQLYGNSSVAGSPRASSQTSDISMLMDGPTATTSTFGSLEMYIPNYNSTGSKPWFDIDVQENNSITANAAYIETIAHLYRGSSGISSITLTPQSGNFVANSNFYLYGIKNS